MVKAGRTTGLSELLSRGRWVTRPLPSPATGDNVIASGVACAARTSCLLAGEYSAAQPGADTNLAEAWNGTSWRIITSKGPTGTTSSSLAAAACPAVSLCLAVGSAGTGTSFQDAAYTWTNGKRWQQVTVPRPRGASTSELSGLACPSTGNCLAVGNFTDASGNSHPFAAHWRSGHWSLTASALSVPKERFTNLTGISCPTTTMCMAAGFFRILSPNVFFGAVTESGSFSQLSCVSQSRCEAVGNRFDPKRSPTAN